MEQPKYIVTKIYLVALTERFIAPATRFVAEPRLHLLSLIL